MAEFCPICAQKMGFEPETLERGEICEGCGATGHVRNPYVSPYTIAIVFIIVLSTIIAAARAQCPTYIGSAPTNTASLIPVVQRQLGYLMHRTDDSSRVEYMLYSDSSGYCSLRIRAKEKAVYEGLTKKPGDLQTQSVYITGPADRIDRLFAWLKETYHNCSGYQAGGQYFFAGDTRFVWEENRSHDGIPLKGLTIEKK